MKAFNKSKKAKRKKEKSYTHLLIWYENCERLLIPLKNVKVEFDKNIVKKITIEFEKIKNEIDKQFHNTKEERIKRLINSNDITIVNLVRLNNDKKLNSLSPRKYLNLVEYVESNPYNSLGLDNLLQTSTYDKVKEILTYEWNTDKRIKIEYIEDKHFFSAYLEIPSVYKEIISKLDHEAWKIKYV